MKNPLVSTCFNVFSNVFASSTGGCGSAEPCAGDALKGSQSVLLDGRALEKNF